MMLATDLRHQTLLFLLPAALATACAAPKDDGAPADGGTPGLLSVGEDDGAGGGSGSGTGTGSSGGEAGGANTADGAQDGDGGDTAGAQSPVLFDLGALPDAPDFNFCGAPSPVTCDNEDDDPWHALGLNCADGPQVEGATFTGAPTALYVHSGNLGTYVPAPYPPQEGTKFVILSSGNAQQMTQAGLFASTSHPGQDPGGTLPAPIQVAQVSPVQNCADDPTLVGTGDCSNTLQGEWSQGSGANDYAELRFTVEVPENTYGFSYNLAMFSTEYPNFYQSGFNDMYVAWLESEVWTGNVSFDEMGNPISLNAGFLDYKDAPNAFDCPAPCTAPELQGTAMQGHAGTKWLTTTAGVSPGETIEVVFAVFDLSDGILDTVVLLDNWLWECEGGPPVTIPG